LQGVLVQDLQSSRFRFFHDRTQQASYQLVPEYKRPGLHLSLGRALLKELSKIELDEHIFLVVDQMSRGLSNDVMDTVEEIKFASLCLKAGEKAASSSDYQTSLKYLKQGRSILDERRDWRDQYDLMLGLHQCIAQSSCCTGDFTAVDETVNLIKKYGRSFDDMIPSYMIHIHAMSARMMFADALDVGLEVLDQLEGGIPKNPKRLHIIASLFNVKWLLYGLSDERLMALPSMLDKKKTQEMVILNLLLNPAYFIRRDLFPCLILRMMKLSLTHGKLLSTTQGLV
jgi:predicted ATPase